MDKINGKCMGAHRVAWIRKHGDIPSGYVICHKCDNGLCVNVEHLFVGTMSDNMRDCVKKGRLNPGNQRGYNNHNARADFHQFRNGVRADRQAGMTYAALRHKYGIKSNGHLRAIITSSV